MFNQKKKFFKKKLRGLQIMIWEREFQRFEKRKMREDIRVEYDNLKTKLDVLNTQIKSEKDKPTMSKDEAARLDDQKLLTEKDLKRYEELMRGLDVECEGTKPTEEYPEGAQGLTGELDSLRAAQLLVKQYIKNL